MQLVVDANVVFSALIADATTRTLLIDLIPDTDLRPHLQTAHAAIGDTDPDDVPYLAAALAIDAAIWSDDGDFTKQSRVEVYTTSDIVAEFGTE